MSLKKIQNHTSTLVLITYVYVIDHMGVISSAFPESVGSVCHSAEAGWPADAKLPLLFVTAEASTRWSSAEATCSPPAVRTLPCLREVSLQLAFQVLVPGGLISG